MPISTGPSQSDLDMFYEGRTPHDILIRNESVPDDRVFNGDGFSRVGHGCDCLCGRCVKRYFRPTYKQDEVMQEADKEQRGLAD